MRQRAGIVIIITIVFPAHYNYSMLEKPSETAQFFVQQVQSSPFDAHALYQEGMAAVYETESPMPKEYTRRIRKRHGGDCSFATIVGEDIKSAVKDVFILNKNLFTWNSFKVITTTFPLFIAARMIDEKLQKCFYDSSCHKNINQLPDWCHTAARVSIGIPIVVLGINAFRCGDEDLRWTSQILLVGMPFVIWTKELIKKIQFDACLRPWNEHFSCEQRAFGGFPSGHMAQALYMTVLYGTRFGPRYAIPLGMIASFIGVTFVTCNRHYLSQIIAGSAFGTIYALAASKLVDAKLTKKVRLGLKVDTIGRPTFSLSATW